MRFSVYRYNPETDTKPYMQDYDVALQPSDRMLLDALVRLKEMDENEARSRNRDQELKARKWPDERIFDLTLKQAAERGLPSPLVITNGVVVTNAATTNKTATTTAATSTNNNVDVSMADADEDSAPKTTNPTELSPEDRAMVFETSRILVDYINLWNSNPPLAAQSPQSQQK